MRDATSKRLTLADVGVDGLWTVRDFGYGPAFFTQRGGAKVVLTTGHNPNGSGPLLVRDADGVLTELTPEHPVARAIVALPQTHDALLEALAWYYDDIYDGAPESRTPEWVTMAREAVADALLGSDVRNARTRHEAVEAAIDAWRADHA